MLLLHVLTIHTYIQLPPHPPVNPPHPPRAAVEKTPPGVAWNTCSATSEGASCGSTASKNRHGFWTSPTCKHQPFAPLGEPPLPHPL
ncbi:unnamed protein product, partial [Ascophyllum nodosum]